GDYPKDIAIFPDGNHLASINHGSNSISFFQVEYKEKLLVMSGRSISVNEPNCCVITKVPTRGKKAD
ncbi:beta-propeller fold lactonase family protein, partial [Clostridium sp.]